MTAYDELLRALEASPEVRPGTAAALIAASHAEVLTAATQAIVKFCPDHGDADETWMVCHCDAANELFVKATFLSRGAQDVLGGGAG